MYERSEFGQQNQAGCDELVLLSITCKLPDARGLFDCFLIVRAIETSGRLDLIGRAWMVAANDSRMTPNDPTGRVVALPSSQVGAA